MEARYLDRSDRFLPAPSFPVPFLTFHHLSSFERDKRVSL